ncbi:MAG: BACON domain-containing protein [Anaerolineales bacterium]|nr:BACON domain-containing protein [Anaerolineales bacterium]
MLDETEQVPVPNGGDWILALQDADGNDLKTYAFTPMELTDGEEVVGRPAVIALIVPAIEGLAKIEIRVGSQVVATRNASATAPVVQITLPAPEQGSVHTLDTLDVAWTASDADGDPLSFSVLYSNDDGATWQTQVTGLTENHYTIDSSLIPGGNNSRVRVLASDGFLGGEAISAPFFIPGHAPQVLINSPVPLATFWPGQSVVLNGSAYDLEDGTLSGSSLIWSSSIDGFLGTGTISDTVNLSTGDHVISLTATDSNGMQRSTQVNIAVVGGAAPEPILIQSSPNALSHIVFEGGAAATLELALGGSDDSSLAWEASADHAWIRLNATSGTLPAQFEVTIAPAGLDVGSYKGIITIAAEGAANAPLEIPVVLEVMQRPTLSLAPGALQYTVVANGEAGEFEINLGSSNDTSLNWQASANTPWISLDPAAGVVPATLVVRILPDGLDPDTYHGVISVAASPAGNSPATILVTLTVKPVDMYLPFLRGTK